MARTFWVNPNDQTDIVEAPDSEAAIAGWFTPAPDADHPGRPPSRNIRPWVGTADPDIWPLGTITDPPQPANDYGWSDRQGPVRTFNVSVVDEAYTWVRRSGHDVHAGQLRLLGEVLDRVQTSNCVTSLIASRVIVLARSQRTRIYAASAGLLDRLKDITVDGEQKPYWPPNHLQPLRVQNVNSGAFETQYVGEPEWGTIMKDIIVHDNAAYDDAFAPCENDVNTAYNTWEGDQSDANWESLAMIDPESYPWPPVYMTGMSATVFRELRRVFLLNR